MKEQRKKEKEDKQVWLDCFCGRHALMSDKQWKRTGHMESYFFSFSHSNQHRAKRKWIVHHIPKTCAQHKQLLYTSIITIIFFITFKNHILNFKVSKPDGS